jgi:hypothetical protein
MDAGSRRSAIGRSPANCATIKESKAENRMVRFRFARLNGMGRRDV